MTLCAAVRGARQARAGRFTKQRMILDRKTAEMPEAELHGGGGHRCGGTRLLKLLSRQVHPSQPQVVDRAHAEMFIATARQRPGWDAES